MALFGKRGEPFVSYFCDLFLVVERRACRGVLRFLLGASVGPASAARCAASMGATLDSAPISASFTLLTTSGVISRGL